jgi:predicted ester cyclase
VDDLFGEDDRVVARFTVKATHQGHFLGVPATGKKVKWTGQPIYRLAGGKIVEEWFLEDTFGLLQKLGAIPAFQPS